MNKVYLNQISTAVPDYNIHQKFIEFAPLLLTNKREHDLFIRMANRTEIDCRYSFFEPDNDSAKLDTKGFYTLNKFPSMQARMAFYEQHAFTLAKRALDSVDMIKISHLIFTTCTGFYAPGIDLQIARYYGLSPSVERTTIGFMGCFAAINALKLSNHIVRSIRNARVLIVNLELCTLHLQKVNDLEKILSFLIFADGCAASVVSAEPKGLTFKSFHSTFLSNTIGHITWHIGNSGFEMVLKGEVPHEIEAVLPDIAEAILAGKKKSEINYWAIHPGGRTILDAVQTGLELNKKDLYVSRNILRQYGNMSSASLMFVLEYMMNKALPPGIGCAMAFGPGLTVESMLFEKEY